MIIPDLNILIAAHNLDHPRHEAARTWWESTVSGPGRVGLSWVVILGFLRLTSNPNVFETPWPIETAIEAVADILGQPTVSVVQPGPRHADTLFAFLRGAGRGGNLTTDAHLAALAVEHGAQIASDDSDFGRFDGLQFFNPLSIAR